TALQSCPAGHIGNPEQSDFEDGKLHQVARSIGEMAEWLKAHAWKACLGETLTWVRIPVSPPYCQGNSNNAGKLSIYQRVAGDCESLYSLPDSSLFPPCAPCF